MPSLSLTKQRNWIRTSSRQGSPARPLLRGCQSLREEPLSQSVPPLVGLKIDQSQRTELYPASRTAAGAKLSQQGVIPVGCGATSVAHSLGGPSATLNAPTLTRVIPNRPTTVSRARLVSGRLLFVKSWIFRDSFQPFQVLLGAVCHRDRPYQGVFQHCHSPRLHRRPSASKTDLPASRHLGERRVSDHSLSVRLRPVQRQQRRTHGF